MRPLVASLSAVLLAAGAAAAVAAPAQAGPPTPHVGGTTPGSYTATAPLRLLDTRVDAPGTLAPGETRPVAVAGKGTPAVPSGASVVLTVTALHGTAGGFVTVFAHDTARPEVSNLNYGAGQTVPNLVLAQVGADGMVSLFNGSSGSVDLLVDLAGYVQGGSVPAGTQGGISPVTPTRLLDSTPVAGATGKGVDVAGHGGVPANATAAILNITATRAQHAGFVTAYPAGGTRPSTSNLNYAPGRTVANLVLVRIGDLGDVTLYNGSTGTVNLLADVQGYITAGDPVSAGRLGSLTSARIVDTRQPHQGGALAAHTTRTIAVGGTGGVPRRGVSAVVLNVTATRASRNGYLTVFTGATRPTASNVNFLAGQTVGNLVVAPVSSTGTIEVYNGSGGTVDVIADVAGWVNAADLTVPPTQVSHYLDNLIDDHATNVARMNDEGCADGTAGDTFVLLDVGAQSYTKPLSKTNPGVAIALTNPTVRFNYRELVAAVGAYLKAFIQCGPKNSEIIPTVAVGTNNSGNFTDSSDPQHPAYDAQTRGTDWAKQVIEALQKVTRDKSLPVSIVGANDIENGDPNTDGFDSSFTRALNWERTYAAETETPLIYNGSANGCPTTYGGNAACEDGWTLSQFAQLTDPTDRVRVLPQVYFTALATQWANIDRVAGGTLQFQGSLTTQDSLSDSLTGPQGWAALHHSIGTVVNAPNIPTAIDIEPATAAGARLVHARAVA